MPNEIRLPAAQRTPDERNANAMMRMHAKHQREIARAHAERAAIGSCGLPRPPHIAMPP